VKDQEEEVAFAARRAFEGLPLHPVGGIRELTKLVNAHSNQTFEEASEVGAGPVFFTFGAIAKMWREQRFQSQPSQSIRSSV
jgi:hypothetical protein